MDRKLIAAVFLAFTISTLGVAGASGPPSDASDASDPIETWWPGMWLWNSEKRFNIHLSGGPISEVWGGPAAYLRSYETGYRESAARWLKALAEHARPALPDLLAVLDDESQEVREAVEEALDAVDPGWRSWSAEELLALAAKAPRHVRIEGSITSYGFPLRGRQAVFPLEAGAEFGVEVEIDDWWGRPRPADLDLAVGDVVVFGIVDPARFAARLANPAWSDPAVEELERSSLTLTLTPVLRPDGVWSFVLDKAEAFEVFTIPDL